MNDFSSALQEGEKNQTREKRTTHSHRLLYEFLLCCPRRVRFLQYELRLDYRQASTAGQRGRDAYSPIERASDLQPQYWPRPRGRQYPMYWQREIVGPALERLQICCDLVEICSRGLVIVFKSSCAIFKRILVNKRGRYHRRHWKMYLA